MTDTPGAGVVPSAWKTIAVTSSHRAAFAPPGMLPLRRPGARCVMFSRLPALVMTAWVLADAMAVVHAMASAHAIVDVFRMSFAPLMSEVSK